MVVMDLHPGRVASKWNKWNRLMRTVWRRWRWRCVYTAHTITSEHWRQRWAPLFCRIHRGNWQHRKIGTRANRRRWRRMNGGGEREHTEFETKAPFRFITQFTSPKRKIRPYKLRHLINEFLDSIRCVALSASASTSKRLLLTLFCLYSQPRTIALRIWVAFSPLFPCLSLSPFFSSFFLTTWNFVSFFRTFASLILSKDHWFFDRFYVLLVFFVPCFSMWNETSDGDEWIGWLVTDLNAPRI